MRTKQVLAALIATAAVAGCAAPRYLNAEEDDAMRQQCETVGCVIIPLPIWMQIRRAIEQRGQEVGGV